MFDPKPTCYPYPEYTDKHYLTFKKDSGEVFDSNYPYIDNSRSFRFKRFWVRFVMRLIVFPLAAIRFGLRIRGRKYIKTNKETLKKGVISCSNHVHMWDYIFLMKAVRPFRTNMLSWGPTVTGDSGALVRLVGGIPIPENDRKAYVVFLKTVREHIANGGWLHLYAEGSMWEYYAPIRPFKRGLGYFAVTCGKPVLPFAFSYREPGFIRKKIFRQIACVTLNVGELIYADDSLPKKERELDLVRRCHDAVCRLAGIDPEKNIYPPVFDDNRRVDYY
ncbi:MAG: 1-acyl-sn-glycerol-3-phosphate acyltransferase [Clostridia bacterium]|nr:1-acyl-sn-glycerol-3-phosphate acyltransferase [Clostridia bacterium]